MRCASTRTVSSRAWRCPRSTRPWRFSIDRERVILMPAGLTVLDAASHAFGRPLQIGRGGLREGILLELAGRAL
jgi:exopolyphosphatase/pppGpp-phosphohydrolase